MLIIKLRHDILTYTVEWYFAITNKVSGGGGVKQIYFYFPRFLKELGLPNFDRDHYTASYFFLVLRITPKKILSERHVTTRLLRI